MSKGDFTWLDREFLYAIAEHSAASGKDISESINRGLRNTGYRAAMETPKESTEEIEKNLRKDKLALKIATKQLRGRIGKSFTTRKGKTRTVKRVTRKQIGRKAKQLITKWQKRRGFLRAGWIAALVASGMKGVRSGDVIRGGKSKLGSGKMASPRDLYAYLGNAVWGRLDGPAKAKTQATMLAALQKAMRYVSKDMIQHAQNKLSKTAKKYSGTKKR